LRTVHAAKGNEIAIGIDEPNAIGANITKRWDSA
jgi:hypothetical protein